MMTEVGGIAGDQLRSYIERIERLNEEEAAIKADKREVFSEAKGNGFDPKTMRQVIAARKLDPDVRDEQETMFDLYMRAIEGSGTKRALAQARVAREGSAAGTPAIAVNATPPDEFDPTTGEVIEPAATEPPAAIPAAPETEPSTPSPDAALPAGECASPSSQSGQGLTPIPLQSHIVREPDEPRATVECPDLPASLKRDPATNRAPWMDKVAAE